MILRFTPAMPKRAAVNVPESQTGKDLRTCVLPLAEKTVCAFRAFSAESTVTWMASFLLLACEGLDGPASLDSWDRCYIEIMEKKM